MCLSTQAPSLTLRFSGLFFPVSHSSVQPLKGSSLYPTLTRNAPVVGDCVLATRPWSPLLEHFSFLCFRRLVSYTLSARSASTPFTPAPFCSWGVCSSTCIWTNTFTPCHWLWKSTLGIHATPTQEILFLDPALFVVCWFLILIQVKGQKVAKRERLRGKDWYYRWWTCSGKICYNSRILWEA